MAEPQCRLASPHRSQDSAQAPNVACNSAIPLSNVESKTLIFCNFRGYLRTYCEKLHATCGETPQRVTRDLRDRWEDANAVVERTPPTACVHSSAQSADHLYKNRRKTAIMAEVVCTLGRLSTSTILINAMHQPDPCPQPPARPLGTTNTQFLHNLACNSPTTHSNLETKTLIFRRFQRRPRTRFEELYATCGEAPQRVTRDLRDRWDRWEDANAVVERTPPTACMHSSAQGADHLDKNRHKTAIMAEVVCTLGRLSTWTILTRTQHRLPTPPQRPTAHTRIGTALTDRL